MMRRLRNLARDERGAAIIELALDRPVLAMLIIGVVDISIAYGRKLELEQAAQRSIEKVMQTTGDTTVAGTITNEAVCQVNGTNADGTCTAGRLTDGEVTVTYRLECDAGGAVVTTQSTGDADTFDAFTCAAGQSEARYIKATAVDTYTPMFPLHFGTGIERRLPPVGHAGMRTQ